MNRLLIIALCACGLGLTGCEDDQTPPPQFNEGAQAGSRTFLPTVVPARKDTTILGAAASAEEVGAAKPAAPDAAAVVRIPIDDSSPEGLLKGFVAIIESANLAQLADIVVPEQQALTRQLVGAIGPVLKATRHIETRWHEKFPDTPFAGPPTGVPGMNLATAPRITDLEMIGDDQAAVTLEAPQAGQTGTILLKRIDNAWRMQSANFQTPPDPEIFEQLLGVFGQFAAALQDIAQRMDNNEFATADEAQAAIQQAAQQIFAPLMTMIAEQMRKQLEGMTPPAEGTPPPQSPPPGGTPRRHPPRPPPIRTRPHPIGPPRANPTPSTAPTPAPECSATADQPFRTKRDRRKYLLLVYVSSLTHACGWSPCLRGASPRIMHNPRPGKP